MGKPKKGKKDKGKDSDNEEIISDVQEPELEEEKPVKPVAKPKAKPKEKVKKQDSDDDSDEFVAGQTMSAFALLGVESGEDDDEDNNEAASEEEEKTKKVVAKQKAKAKKPKPAQTEENLNSNQDTKKKKGKKKAKNEEEDEIEKMLEELQLEYTGNKESSKKEESSAKQETEKKENKKSKKKSKPQTTAPENEESVVNETDATEAKKPDEKKEAKSSAKPKAGAKETKDVKEEPAESKKKKGADAKDATKDETADGKKKKGPNKAMVAMMQERLKAVKEEEERLKKEEEEKMRLEEEAERLREEQKRLELEKKERKKQKEKERKERLKAEGKLLSEKQKRDKARAAAMLEALKAQGADIPEVGEKRPRPGTRVRAPKLKQETSVESKTDEEKQSETPGDSPKETSPDTKTEEEKIKDAWDEESDDDFVKIDPIKDENATNEKDDSESGSEDESEEDEDEEESSEEESEDDGKTEAEKMREKAMARISKRSNDAEKHKNVTHLRAAVVCVLGHVDTGKTKILDKLRRTNVQDSEAGGITQQIGATNVPVENIKEQTKFIQGFSDFTFQLPGLLIIDTPGHESFSNLRSRGSSLCDIAILVVDIMHGLEPQTIESINLLKKRKTPFVVALNKIDRLYDWQTYNRKDIRDIIKNQAANTQREFQQRTNDVIVQFAEQGLNAALFYENPDPKTYISLVPTSAITGEGMGNLLFLIIQFCQGQLPKRLMFSEELQATVLEVKAISGLGTTIDVILVNGRLREGQTMILAGSDGPIVTQIKALLMPQPMKELRVKNAYIEHKEVVAAQGVKIAAKELEKAIAGLNLQIAQKPDEVEIFKEIVARDLKSVLNSIKLSDRGVYVQASTLGSLEALLQFLKDSKIPYSGVKIGPVVKKDISKASIMLEHDSQYATILAFDVKVERDAQEMADSLGVKIFQADIIYHLFDKFTAYREELKQRKRDEFKNIAVFPCKLKILPQFIFNTRDPIVLGVMVEAGIVKEGTPICVPSKDFIDIGVVTSIESNHKNVETARKGQEVCIKIESTGDAPKMFGRHFDETDLLVSKISRQSIDACKDYFRDDLLKSDWSLMVELKKTFQIL